MNTCPSLFNAINFEPDAILPCCNVWGLKSVPRFSFTGGRVNMAAYAGHIEKTAEALQTEGGVCAGCPELKTCSGPETVSAAIRFKTVSINKHRYLCNCRCVYCDFWKANRPSYDILPPLRSLRAQNALDDDCLFSWGGGEPSILHEFEEASAWVLRSGYRQYVHTNALRFSPAIASLLQQNAGGVNISLDSGTPETYKAVKGLDAFARITENIRKYAAGAANPRAVHLKYIIFEQTNTIKDIDGFFDVCRMTGVTDVQLSFNFIEVNAGTVSDSTLRAAIHFITRAISENMHYTTFYVNEACLEKMRRMVDG